MNYNQQQQDWDQQNPYAAQVAGYPTFAAQAEVSERTQFIRNTYAHLCLAILAFAAIEVVVFTAVGKDALIGMMMSLGGWSWLIFLGMFMLVSWVARSWAESDTSKGMQYAGLILYVLAEAAIFVPLLTMAVYFTQDPQGLFGSAILLTLMIFGGLTAIVFMTKADFSFLRMYLMLGGLIALGLVFCGVLFGFSLGLWFSVAMIALASGYILYDTSNILHHYRTDQYVAASLALFASVALLFWYVLRLLMYLQSE